MIRLLLFFFLTFLISCTPGDSSESTEETADTTQEEQTDTPPADNTLTAEEQQAGWELLFDGTSMDKFKVYKEDALRGWKVEDGLMIALGEAGPEGIGADLITKEEFENFELSLDWKVSKAGNSGIFFNVIEDDKYEAVYHTGPEYQIVDDEGFPDPLEDWQKSGANYAMHPPAKFVAKPQGEFNTSMVKVNQGHVEHWLNGEKVVEYDLWTAEWEALIKSGKWKEFPDYGKAKKGHLAIQDHGHMVWFKNIKLRRL